VGTLAAPGDVSQALERRIEAEYMARTGVQRRPTCVQLERMVLLARILSRKDPLDGSPVHWTWPQLAKALGFPVMGMSTQGIKDRHETAVKRTMRYLVGAGYVTGWEVKYDGREPTGILVTLPAGVAQSVRAARYRRRGEHPSSNASARLTSARSRSFSGAKVCAPHGGLQGGGNSRAVGVVGGSSASARLALSTRDRARLATDVRAALESRPERSTEQAGRETLEAIPWLAEVPPAVLLREAVRARHDPPEQLATLALSAKWERRLDTAVRQLCRVYGSSSAGAAELLSFAWGGVPEAAARHGRHPYSLGGYAVLLRKRAHRRRRDLGARKVGQADRELQRLGEKGLA
jgi:hypothetical protein